jgi:serine/threonine-protein kinase RsbW
MGESGSNRPKKHSTGPSLPARRAGRASASRATAAGKSNHAGRRHTLRVTIPSDFNHARDVQKRILDDISRVGFNSQSQFAIKLALEEALINAIKHGNKLDPRKTVQIEATVTPSEAIIIIEDQGPGFLREAVPDPTLDENLEKCSGRGILLIEAYMNAAEWTHGGRRLRMIKKNDLAPPST